MPNDEIIEHDGKPALPNPLYLFRCNWPEEKLKQAYPKLWQYIEEGISNGADKGYNCRNRTPWYACETREPSPLLVTHMGRPDNEDRMFRFIRNDSKAVATNSYLLLYPKPEFKQQLRKPDVLKAVWKILNEIPKNELRKCGRVYGGGLYKIEPKELLNAPAAQLESVLKREPTLF